MPGITTPHLQLSRRVPWRRHLWLFRQYCSQRALCPTRSFQPESRRSAPLLCAGITTYSPMRHWGVTKGKKVGVVGLGGLGHMAVKFAHALGAHVVVFTTSPNKKEDALRLGADEVVVSRNTDEMSKHEGSSTSSSTRSLPSMTLTHTYNYSAATATSPSSAHRTSLMPSRPLALYSSVATFWFAHRGYCRNAGNVRLLRQT